MRGGRTNRPLESLGGSLYLGRLFLACSSLVAHRQLPGVYGPSLSMRSTVCCHDGLGPMSLKKA